MAIAFIRANTASASFSFDGGSGSGRLLVLAVAGFTTDNITAASWNGESFSLEGKQQITGGRYHYVYTLVPSGTGSQTMTITTSGSAEIIGTVLLYSGVASIKNVTLVNTQSTTGTMTISANNGDWLVCTFGNNTATIAAGTNTTQRDSLGSSIGQFDSNGVASPTALNLTWNGNNTNNGGVGLAMVPIPETTTSTSSSSSSSVSTSSSSVSTSSSSSSSVSTSSSSSSSSSSSHSTSSSTILITNFMIGADTDGDVQLINNGTSDDGAPIYYELETQELEFGNRSHLKSISNKITVFTRNGDSSSLQAKEDDGDYKDIPIQLNRSVNIGQDIQLEGHYFTFKWSGESSTESPSFEGIYLEDIDDKGMTYK